MSFCRPSSSLHQACPFSHSTVLVTIETACQSLTVANGPGRGCDPLCVSTHAWLCPWLPWLPTSKCPPGPGLAFLSPVVTLHLLDIHGPYQMLWRQPLFTCSVWGRAWPAEALVGPDPERALPPRKDCLLLFVMLFRPRN